MRIIIPAIALVLLLCFCVRWTVDEWLYFRGAEEQMRQVAAAQIAQLRPATSQPTTQPVETSALGDGLE